MLYTHQYATVVPLTCWVYLLYSFFPCLTSSSGDADALELSQTAHSLTETNKNIFNFLFLEPATICTVTPLLNQPDGDGVTLAKFYSAIRNIFRLFFRNRNFLPSSGRFRARYRVRYLLTRSDSKPTAWFISVLPRDAGTEICSSCFFLMS